MTENIDSDVLERLEAEATVADADPEELTIAVESEIDNKESEIEELESDLEEKETEVEEMQEQIDSMAENYAEELASHSDVMDEDDFLDRFEFEELQEKVEDLEEADSSPAPNSGDPGAGFQSPEEEEAEEGEEVDLSEAEELAAGAFEDRATRPGKDYWADIAEDIQNGGD